jgi:Ead/Ea22-like protein
MSDYAKLRALALSATPGDWRTSINASTVYVETTQAANDGTLYGSIVWIPEDEDDRLSDDARAQAAFIAAANPQAVIALLDALAAMTAARDEACELADRFDEGYDTDGGSWRQAARQRLAEIAKVGGTP